MVMVVRILGLGGGCGVVCKVPSPPLPPRRDGWRR
ncbi:hypothetical protein A2U01_0046358, partial [Trifolium medium]|nr:hypothetical protein [Trifolium medium]